MEFEDEYADDGAFQLAEIRAFRDERTAAFEWLDRAYDQRDAGLMWLKGSPLLAGLHDDPRWLKFLEKMGLAG